MINYIYKQVMKPERPRTFRGLHGPPHFGGSAEVPDIIQACDMQPVAVAGRTTRSRACLPRRLVENDIEFGLVRAVKDAPAFERRAYVAYRVRSARLDWVEQSLSLIRARMG